MSSLSASQPCASTPACVHDRTPTRGATRDTAPARGPGGAIQALMQPPMQSLVRPRHAAASASPWADGFAPAPPPPLPTHKDAAAAPRAAAQPDHPDHPGPDALVDLDADFTTLMLAINRLSDSQIQDMLASIDDTARMNRGLIKSQLAAAERQAAAIAKQESASAASFWLGLLGDILLLVASVLLTVVTGGAGAFLMTMAIANVALTAWDIVARIHQQRTGQDISLAAGLAAFAQEVCGADEKTAQEAGQWTALAVKLLAAVGSIASTVRSAAQAAGHVRTFTTTMQVAGTVAQLGEAGTGVYRNYQGNAARHAHLDESSIRALSAVFKERLERALQALDLQFGQRQEFTRGVRRNLELMHESRNIPFSQYA
ncbi:MAG: hypothetical protein ACRYHA_34645 [Janthinobacterium lividum]